MTRKRDEPGPEITAFLVYLASLPTDEARYDAMNELDRIWCMYCGGRQPAKPPFGCTCRRDD